LYPSVFAGLSGNDGAMEQVSSQIGEFNETTDQLAGNILTTFTFEKRRDGLSISVAGFSALAPAVDTIKGIKGVIYWQRDAIPDMEAKIIYDFPKSAPQDSNTRNNFDFAW